MSLTWFFIWFSIVVNALLGFLLIILPAANRRTLPLGVSVPFAHTDDDVVQGSIRRFRLLTIGAWVISTVFTFATASLTTVTVASLPVLLFIVLGSVAYFVARQPIRQAKREQGWYDNVPVRLSADIRAEPYAFRPPVLWCVVAVVILLIAMGVGAVLYPSLPDPIPTHWNGAGRADIYSPKSIWSVFGPLFIGFGMIALLFGCSYLSRISPIRIVPTETAEQYRIRQAALQRLLSTLLGQIAIVLSLMIAWLTIIGWTMPSVSWVMMVSTLGFLLVLAVILVASVVRYTRLIGHISRPVEVVAEIDKTHAQKPEQSSEVASESTSLQAPDDDQFWKGGFVYINKNDPAVFVPKRFGIGWTINLGSIGGIIFGVVTLIIIIGSITVGIVAGASQ